MDALSLLRNETIAGRKVEKKGDLLLFGDDFASPCSVETNYKARTTNTPYTIEALWFLLQRPTVDHGRYLLEAKKLNIPVVARADRKDILAYLKGEISTSDRVDSTAFVPPVLGRAEAEAAVSQKRAAEDSGTDAGEAKRARSDAAGTDGEAAQSGSMQRQASEAVPMSGVTSGSASRVSVLERDAKTKRVLDLELKYNNRLTALLSTKKFDSVLAYLDRKSDKAGASRTQSNSSSAVTTRKPLAAYDRYDQPAAKAQGAEFGISEAGTFVSQEEAPLAKADAAPKRKPKTNRTPIIIVPSGLKETITLYNVQGYLENGSVVPTAVAAKANTTGRPQHVIVNRKRDSTTKMYKVVDNVSAMTPEHWDRVVACFVAGPEWQFKRWPLYANGGTAQLFSKVRGFYVYYDDQKIHDTVESWDVTKLLISKNKPHLDKTTSLRFWEVLDEHTKAMHNDLNL